MLPNIRVCDSIDKHIAERRKNVPNIKSQMKRVRTDAEKNERNTARKTRVKNSVKRFNAAVEAGDAAAAEAAFRAAEAEIDTARRDGIYHKNTAARKTASLARILNGMEVAGPETAAPAETPAAEPAAQPEKPRRLLRRKTDNA